MMPPSDRSLSQTYLPCLRSGVGLRPEERLPAATVDAAGQFRDKRPGVLSDDQGVTLRKLPDLFRTKDGYVVAVEAAAPTASMEVVAAPGDPGAAEQVGDLLVKLAVLPAAEDHDVVGE